MNHPELTVMLDLITVVDVMHLLDSGRQKILLLIEI